MLIDGRYESELTTVDDLRLALTQLPNQVRLLQLIWVQSSEFGFTKSKYPSRLCRAISSSIGRLPGLSEVKNHLFDDSSYIIPFSPMPSCLLRALELDNVPDNTSDQYERQERRSLRWFLDAMWDDSITITSNDRRFISKSSNSYPDAFSFTLDEFSEVLEFIATLITDLSLYSISIMDGKFDNSDIESYDEEIRSTYNFTSEPYNYESDPRFFRNEIAEYFMDSGDL